jgi:hypothetical protein
MSRSKVFDQQRPFTLAHVAKSRPWVPAILSQTHDRPEVVLCGQKRISLRR